jgi:hypothetical protein
LNDNSLLLFEQYRGIQFDSGAVLLTPRDGEAVDSFMRTPGGAFVSNPGILERGWRIVVPQLWANEADKDALMDALTRHINESLATIEASRV